MNNEKLEQLWDEFANVALDENDCTIQEFHTFDAGTDRIEIWQWFDENHSEGTAYLLGMK